MTLHVAIHHSFGGFDIDVAFDAPAGITALFGRSGAGKTTIINAVAGLLTPQRGRISVDETCLLDTERTINVPVHQRRIGYVFQDARLFPHLTVEQNLKFGQWFSKPDADAPEPEKIIALLGIGHLLQRRPNTLSGGEKQRVAIGRALLANPRLLLMDEPLAALDEERKTEILPYLERLRDDLEMPIVYVSHAVAEIARLATTIVVLNDGRVIRHGSASEVLADAGSQSALDQRDAGAVLNASVRKHDDTDGITELAFSGGTLFTQRIDASPGIHLRVRIKARDILLALTPPQGTSALNILPAVVRKIGPLEGPGINVVVRCGDDDLLARITRRSLTRLQLQEGTACYIIIKSIAVARRDIGIFEPRHG